MPCRTCFITGTDTDAGKTWATLALMQAVREAGHRVAGMKPLASGASLKDGRLVNDDAEQILALCSQAHNYDDINPYPLERPVSPGFAARQADVVISLERLVRAARHLQKDADFLFIEGVGGWRVPWGDGVQARDLVRALKIPVILVVGLRLGCINHALLTAEALAFDDVPMLGWLASRVDPDYQDSEATLDLLAAALDAPGLGVLPHLAALDPQTLAVNINVQDMNR